MQLPKGCLHDTSLIPGCFLGTKAETKDQQQTQAHLMNHQGRFHPHPGVVCQIINEHIMALVPTAQRTACRPASVGPHAEEH